MRKVNSSSSYSQFRKKNPNLNQSPHKEIGAVEIDQLAKQLEMINSIKPLPNHKYDLPNGIIEQEEEEDFSTPNSDKKIKSQNSTLKKLKTLNTKVQVQPNKLDSHKLNKTIDPQVNQRKQKEKQKQKQINMKNSVKLPKKVVVTDKNPKMNRRMSLTNLSTKNSLISTNQSLNSTTISQTQKQISHTSQAQKQILLEKIKLISQKIQKKQIGIILFAQLLQNIQKMEEILQNIN